MRTFGLKPQELVQIKNLLQKFFGDLNDVKVYLFGSRATGKQKDFSDIDLAINSKSTDLIKRIALFNEEFEKTNIPYKVDLTPWKEIYKPYLPRIKTEKKDFWKPESREIHPWRACPYGEHWVVRHPRFPIGRQVQDVDGHCRKNRSGKDVIYGDEIVFISKTSPFLDTKPLPCPRKGTINIPKAQDYDVLIAGWCKYWNEIFKTDIPIDPNFIKALIESESSFNSNAIAKNGLKGVGSARGLIQITEQTLKILKDKKGELKDHFIDLKKEELFDPSKNICAAIRWLFHKREILRKRLGRSPTWVEAVVEYKGLGRQLKNNGKKATEIVDKFNLLLGEYRC